MPNERSPMAVHEVPLSPVRHPNLDFFVCDITDANPKDDVGSMEHPMFALRPGDKAIRRYEHNGNKLEIIPSTLGLATIHDKDVLLYCTSQLTEALNQGLQPSRTVRVTAYDLLVSTNRPVGGVGYQRLREALDRLVGTRLKTTIRTNGTRQTDAFGLIESYRIVESSPSDGRMVALTITLSQWLYNAIIGRQVLTLSRDYFRLRRPLERRLYELARKHCGGQPFWKCSLTLLHKKTGTTSDLREFRRLVLDIAAHQHLPDYELVHEVADGSVVESVTFQLRTGDKAARVALAREHEALDLKENEQLFRDQWEREHPGHTWPGIMTAIRDLGSSV